MNPRQLCFKCLKLGAAIAICAIALLAGDDHDKDNHCHKSPENPAIVLALVGAAGVAWQYLRGRARQ